MQLFRYWPHHIDVSNELISFFLFSLSSVFINKIFYVLVSWNTYSVCVCVFCVLLHKSIHFLRKNPMPETKNILKAKKKNEWKWKRVKALITIPFRYVTLAQ